MNMKNTIITALSLLILASCAKEPTLGDKLEGVWVVNKVTATGTVDILGSVVPVVAEDTYINPDSSQFSLTQDPNSVTYSVDAVISANLGTTIDLPFKESGSGTWTTKPGNGTAPDSVFLNNTDGTTVKYEVMGLLESSVTLRTNLSIEFMGSNVNMLTEFGFAKN
tara:strand:+ start:1237 stop:1734 length:498 start_codon:yes stop_codon:yes gene_type:complete